MSEWPHEVDSLLVQVDLDILGDVVDLPIPPIDPVSFRLKVDMICKETSDTIEAIFCSGQVCLDAEACSQIVLGKDEGATGVLFLDTA